MNRAVGRGRLSLLLLVACLAVGGGIGGTRGLPGAHGAAGRASAGPWHFRLRGGGGGRGGDAHDSERDRVVTASILKRLAQKGGADASDGVRKKGAKKTKAGSRADRAEAGGETFERDGLEFRRDINDDAEYLLREGRLGEDPLERAREFMDSDEIDDWDALYEDADPASGGRAAAEHSRERLRASSSAKRTVAAAVGDAQEERRAGQVKEKSKGKEQGPRHTGGAGREATSGKTASGSPARHQEAGAVDNVLGLQVVARALRACFRLRTRWCW